jgi:DNA-binding response OmpR family regulator
MSTDRPILVVDDDAATRRLVARSLELAGYVVVEADGLVEARLRIAAEPALVILDVVLAEGNGLDLLREVRAQSGLPVILLTGRREEADRIEGLDLGADDYVVKPFSPAELAARVRSVLRRASGTRPLPQVLTFDELTVDTVKRVVALAGEPVMLTRREYEVLVFLACRPGQVFTRSDLLEQVWSSSQEWQDPATVTEHVRRLRRKLEADPAQPRWLKTARGAGYLFDHVGDYPSS